MDSEIVAWHFKGSPSVGHYVNLVAESCEGFAQGADMVTGTATSRVTNHPRDLEDSQLGFTLRTWSSQGTCGRLKDSYLVPLSN